MRASFVYLCLVGVVAVGIGWAGSASFSDSLAMRAHYCSMVDAWNKSGGVVGWPNYDDAECPDV